MPKNADVEQVPEEASAESTDQLSEGSCDQIPVRQSSNQDRFISNRREMINKPVTFKEAPRLPGVMNIKQQAEEEARKKRERETLAAVTI